MYKKSSCLHVMLLFSMVFVALSHCLEETGLIEHVKRSITKSYKHHSRLTEDILRIKGMSSNKVRRLLNNLCSLPNTSYLEIGTWAGSTFVAALYNNENTITSAIAMDNWSEFAGPKELFFNNVTRYLSRNKFTFYETDAFAFDVNNIAPQSVNIFFYDGNHSKESQKKAFTYFNTVFSDVFIAVVDDWNLPEVEAGTRESFTELGYTILFERILPARFINDTRFWWNGLYVAVIRKNSN